MSTSQQPETTTRMFARVIGPFLTIAILTAAANVAHLRTIVAAFNANPLWPWVAGAFTLLIGLIVIAVHPYWRGATARCRCPAG